MLSDLKSTITQLMPYRFFGEERSCELCGESDYRVVGRRGRNGQRLRTVLCRKCGLVFTNPMPMQGELDRFYRSHYRERYQGATTPSRHTIAKCSAGASRRAEMLFPFINPGSMVVDVGAASGEFVHEANRRGFRGIGIEPHRGFAAFARTHYQIEILQAGWEDVQLAPGSAGLVTANHVLEHFRHPLAAMMRFREWLRPDGYLYISVPDIQNPQRTPYGRFHLAHLYNFNHASLVMLGLRAGFEPHHIVEPNSTSILFRRTHLPVRDWLMFPDNAAVLDDFFRTYTNRRHFLSSTPYRRWARRMLRLGGGMVVAQFAVRPSRLAPARHRMACDAEEHAHSGDRQP